MNEFKDSFDTLVDDLQKRLNSNNELVQWFGQQFGVEVDTLGCVAEQIGRLDTFEVKKWLMDLSEEDYDQISSHVFNSVLMLREDIILGFPREHIQNLLEEERFKVHALSVRGHKGLEDMRNVLLECEERD